MFATAARTKPDAPAQLGGAGTARPKLRLQRKCAPCASGTGHACPACEEEDEKQAIELQRKPLGEAAPALGPTSLGVLVDDDQPVGPGQMSRSIFMAALRAELAAVCDRELAAAGRSSRACPYLSYWMAYYERRPAAQIERAVRLYTGVHTPEPATLLAAVVSRVQVAVRRWALTGEVTGVPAAAVLGGLRGETGERASSPPVQTKSILSEGSGPSGVPSSPVAVQAQLGGGQALDAGVRGRMERGFGTSLSRVRIHTEATAARLAQGLRARAFTVGHDVAFGAGEYQPGTLAGDLLIAHELSHVIQQQGVSAVEAQGAAYDSLEDDANSSAAAAVFRWGRTSPSTASPGLRLQRCASDVCPPGYCWQVVDAKAGWATCTCYWRCLPAPRRGMSIEDPYAPRPLPPTDRRSGFGALGAGTDPVSPVCGCTPISSERGPVCPPGAIIEPSEDIRAVAGPIAHAAGGPYRPPPTTEPRPRPPIAGPREPGAPAPVPSPPARPGPSTAPAPPTGAGAPPEPGRPVTPPTGVPPEPIRGREPPAPPARQLEAPRGQLTSEPDPRDPSRTVYEAKRASADPDIQAEVRMAERLRDSGYRVHFTAGGHGEADLRVNDIPTDVKHLSRAEAGTLRNTIGRGASQGEQVVIDGTTVRLTRQTALEGIAQFEEQAGRHPGPVARLRVIIIVLGDGTMHVHHRGGAPIGTPP